MARGDCRCRVPIAEFGIAAMTTRDSADWLKANGVTDMEPDYLGRPSISIDDAYKLRAKAIEAEKEAERRHEIRLAIGVANKERQAIYNKAMTAETLGHGRPPEGAMSRSLKLVAAYERTLPREVRAGLDGISTMYEMTF